jgi:hypothetical protein
MTRLPTTTKTGAPHYANCYKNLQQDYAAVNRQLAASIANSKLLHAEIDRLLTKKSDLQCDNEQLQTEACRSISNLSERNYYRRSARLWCICSGLLLVGILSLAVWL